MDISTWSTEKWGKKRIKMVLLKLLGRLSHVLLVAGRIVVQVESRNITLTIHPFGGTLRDLMSLLGISLVPTKEVPRKNPSLACQ